MQFIFIGDKDGHGPEVSTHFGVEFVKGSPSEVSDKSAIAKLSANSHFKVVAQKEPPKEPDADREALVAAYVEKFGKKPHHKLSDEKIQEALNADND